MTPNQLAGKRYRELLEARQIIDVLKKEATVLVARVHKLQAQLPGDMQDCTIIYNECPKGHGGLTAMNWVQHPCQMCEVEQLKAQLKRKKK